MKKFGIAAASLMLGLALALSASVPNAWAKKVDCEAVMSQLQSGKTVKEVAADLKISRSSVYRCRKHAKQEAKAATKSHKMTAKTEGAKEAGAMPSAAASPAAKK
jgi:DNA-binding CsgD family transcriptional regulator